jgi:dTDP-glucose pyrophosphorylase/CBS domain-containing protein
MVSNLADLCIPPTSSLRDAIACIDHNGQGIALVTDVDRHLIGTITDGDVRRAVLAGDALDAAISELLARKAHSPNSRPVTAPAGTDDSAILQLMQDRAVRQVTIVDEDNRVLDLITWDELSPERDLPLQAVIMAGGKGSRLQLLTQDLPKPMLPVGDRPLMERTIEHLAEAGIKRIHITTNYLAQKITEHFGDGSAFGVDLNYIAERQPLGTAGSIGLLERPHEPLLVINGDVLTDVNFRAMLDYHKEQRAALTVAVRQYEFTVPYGVVESTDGFVQKLVEKPSYTFFINAGIYLLDPSVHHLIPTGGRMDMTELIQRLLEEGRTVASFPIREYWLDIGQHTDYEQAQEDIRNGRVEE